MNGLQGGLKSNRSIIRVNSDHQTTVKNGFWFQGCGWPKPSWSGNHRNSGGFSKKSTRVVHPAEAAQRMVVAEALQPFITAQARDLTELIEGDAISEAKKVVRDHREKLTKIIAEWELLQFECDVFENIDLSTETFSLQAQNEDCIFMLHSDETVAMRDDQSPHRNVGAANQMLEAFSKLELQHDDEGNARTIGDVLGVIKGTAEKYQATLLHGFQTEINRSTMEDRFVTRQISRFQDLYRVWADCGIIDLIEGNIATIDWTQLHQEAGNTFEQNAENVLKKRFRAFIP